MSQVPPVIGLEATSPKSANAGVSALGSEKNARSPAPANVPALAPKKLRSCLVCRTRKVRCDRQSPCSRCRQANIACVVPSTARPPRWARRLERLTNNAALSNAPAVQDADPNVAKVMDRLRNLEYLVKELSGQLEQANAATSSAGGGSTGANSPAGSTQDTSTNPNSGSVQKQFGRLVHQDASRSRYVSSGFWSRVNDEVRRPHALILTGWLTKFHYSSTG